MVTRNGRLAVVSLVAVAALTLAAGCGEKKGTGAASGPKVSTSVDAALAKLVPDSIKSDGVLKIGTDPSYAPSEFLDTDGKTVVGFDVELFDAVAKKLGLKTEWVSSKFDDIIPGVESGKYEIGVSSFTINDKRLQQVSMVSYFKAGTQWATKKGNPSGIQPDSACGKSVAVQTATVQETDDLPAKNKKCTDAGKPAIKVHPYQAQDDATSALVSGKDDAMLADSPVVAYAVQKTSGQLELLGDIYDSAPYGYVVGKDQAQFAQALQGAVKALIADGTYKKIMDKWNVTAGSITDPQVNPKG